MLGRLFESDEAPDGYYSPRFTYARQIGEEAARGLSDEQRMLQGIWRQEPGGLAWAEARPVIHYAWRLTREALTKKDPA